MSVRLDPRRRDQLKRLAAEADMRPGELVTRWIIERLDGGQPSPAAGAPSREGSAAALEALGERVAALEQQVAALAASPAAPDQPGEEAAGEDPRDAPHEAPRDAPHEPRVPLHEEIAAVIREGGPMPAAEIATRVAERNRYRAPRSARAIDAATVNSRVSNPHYRDRFVRREGRIGLNES